MLTVSALSSLLIFWAKDLLFGQHSRFSSSLIAYCKPRLICEKLCQVDDLAQARLTLLHRSNTWPSTLQHKAKPASLAGLDRRAARDKEGVEWLL